MIRGTNNTEPSDNVSNTANENKPENQNVQNKEKKDEKNQGPKAGTDQKLTEPTLNKK